MKAIIVSVTFIVACVMSAQVDAKGLAGTWRYTTSGSWKKGPCPIGKDGPGTIEVKARGKKLTLRFVSGRVCRPASMCVFEGKVAGKKLAVSNSATVDGEGGKVKNEITLKVTSAKLLEGKGTSSYTHPGGMKCSWGAKIKLMR